MKRFLILFFLLSVFVSFAQKPVFNETKGSGNFTVLIPDYLIADESLNSDASLQYSCAAQEMYIIVIVDSKQALKDAGTEYTLQTYFDFASKNIQSMVENSKLEKPKKSKINGNASLIGAITGKFKEYDIYYKLTIVESASNFYQVLTWTLASNKKKYEKDMDTMLKSLKEI
jgi:hypothetical protein